MRVLVQILQYPPDVNPTGTIVEQVARGLARRGHHVDVITTFPHYARFRMDESRFVPERVDEGGVRVTRLPVFANGRKDQMTSRFLSYASFTLLSGAAMAVSRPRPDVVLSPNGSFFSGLGAAFHASFREVPYVLNIQDLYPDTPYEAGLIPDGLALRALRRLERFMYDRAAHITVIAPSFRARLIQKGVHESKVSVIPNFVDVGFIRPLPRDNPISTRLGLDGKTVIAYSGNLGHVYDFASILDAAAALAHRKDVQFLIVGDGAVRGSIAARIESEKLDNVQMLPFQPRAELPWLRASVDIQLSLYRAGASRTSLASKTYEILASGRPIVASADPGSDLESLIVRSGAGVCLSPEDPSALVEALVRLVDDPAERARMGKRGRALAEAEFSPESIACAYEQILSRMANIR